MDQSISEVVHETAKDLYEAELIDITAMRKFDALCLSENKKEKPSNLTA